MRAELAIRETIAEARTTTRSRARPKFLKRRATALWLLAALTVFGLVLRSTGLSFMLPHTWEPDSLVLVRQAEYIASETKDAERDVFYGYYPHLIARLTTLVPQNRPEKAPKTLEEHLEAASASRVHIRAVIAALSVLVVPGTWWLARRFMRRGPALFAAGLASASVLQLWFAQETRPHALSSVFALLAVLAFLHLRRRPDASAYVLAGLATVFATCSLQNGIAVLIPLCVAHVLRAKGGIRYAHLALGAILVVVALCVRVYYPFMFAASDGHDAAALGVAGGELQLSGHGIRLHEFDGRGFRVVLGALANYEPLLAILGVLGVAMLAVEWRRKALWKQRVARASRALSAHSLAAIAPKSARRPRDWFAGREDLAVVLSYVVPYFVVIGLYAHSYQRFLIPLVPFAACFGAWALFTACDRFVHARGRVVGGAAASVLLATTIFGAQAWAAIRLVQIREQPDTTARAAAWIRGHLDPRRDVIAYSPNLDFPLFRTQNSLASIADGAESLFPWIQYQRRLAPRAIEGTKWDLRPIPAAKASAREALETNALAHVLATGADYAVVEDFDDSARPYAAPVRAGLARGALLVARFSPMRVDTGDDRPLGFQDDYFDRRAVWWWRAILARSMGPVIEIYRLPPIPS